MINRPAETDAGAHPAHAGAVPLGMAIAAWPSTDRIVWERAQHSTGLFDQDARLVGLAPDTLRGREQGFGRFLRFLEQSGLLTNQTTVIPLLTPEIVDGYLVSLRERVRAGSVFEEACRLQSTCRVLFPGQNFSWIRRLPHMPKSFEVARSRKPILIPQSSRLVHHAIKDFASASTAPIEFNAAIAARDALIVMFAATFTLRLKNLIGIRLGIELICGTRGWCIAFSRTLKTDAAIMFDVPAWLQPYLERYLALHRPILVEDGPRTDALWISRRHQPLSPIRGSEILTAFSQKHLGCPLNNHSFRHGLASTFILANPGDADLAAAALGHNGTRMVHDVYGRSAGFAMSRLWLNTLKSIRRSYGQGSD